MSRRRRGLRVPVGVRAVVSAALLAAIAWATDPSELLQRARDLRGTWVAAALALSLVQVFASAWRWRFTARRLGLDLPYGMGLREYYLAMFLNQVLPGGVLGDVSRAWRHARAAADVEDGGGSAAVRAVVLERASGQLVMAGVAALSFLSLTSASRTGTAGVGLLGALGLGIATAVYGRRFVQRAAARSSVAARFASDARAALLQGGALAIQLSSSGIVIGTYLGMFLCAARAVGVDTPSAVLLPLIAPVLLTMLIPVTIAGWGVREGAAAALWAVVGLTPLDGVLVSAGYGLLVLLSTLPGALMLLAVSVGANTPTGAPGRVAPDADRGG